MKTVISYKNNFYPYLSDVIPNNGDYLFLDYDIDDTHFFLVQMKTIDIANSQIILSLVKI